MKLVRLSEGKWLVHAAAYNVYCVGGLAECRQVLIDRLSIEPAEVDLAVEWMNENDHNVADFGLAGCVTHTCREEIPEQMAA